MKKRNITLFTAFAAAIAFASAAQAQTIISGVTATARSELGPGETWGFLAADAVNGVGMTGEGATGEHQNTDHGTGWTVSQAGNIAHWFKVDLGASYDVGNMYVWNGAPPEPAWGARTVDIYYATTDPGNNTANDGVDFVTTGWTFWGTVADLAQHANTGSYLPTDTIALDVNAQYIVLVVTAAHLGINNTSIAELQFSTAGSTPPAADPEITDVRHLGTTVDLDLEDLDSAKTYKLYRDTVLPLSGSKVQIGGDITGTTTTTATDTGPLPVDAYYQVEQQP